ncbi:hypothetical protein [Hirschia baltica]|uniref:Lipoprotein n=1 Tax=Hirschia baltica (strain ATCC 49814 / DSM 5838 / IFAM 1418) TaxID=582402 RepID=C6XQ11_HIRBI|nr:hypothetical protein [Hirschia baltica]ACT58528.1 hypothetical protein Hbal_0834 [Hirschia baltica ATCC 49814]
MKLKFTLSAIAAAVFASACQSTLPSDMRVAEYCAAEENAAKGLCQISFEVDGQKTALSDTNLRVSEARTIADQALMISREAREEAKSARSLASAALNKQSELACKTVTIQKSDTGSCEAGYTLMGCTQTRYTTRAGGLSFLREVNNKSCRFNSRVLEMQVRCCAAGVETQQYSSNY